jgi:ABC-type Fe3+ transport system substrate-binding protein
MLTARSLTWSGLLVGLVALIACAPASTVATPPPAQPAQEAKPASPVKATSRDELLKPLIEGARQEGEVVVTGIDSAGKAGADDIARAFNAAFGLNIRVKYDVEGQVVAQQTKAISEFKSGVPPTYDVVQGVTETMFDFCNQGACDPVENWEQLLPPGVPAAAASPQPLEGRIFKFGDRLKGIVYNTKIFAAADIPKTVRDLGDPKFKGKFFTAPWVSSWLFGPLVYPKDEWLTMLERIGENKAATIQGAAGMQRLALGEFGFEAMANTYQHFQAEAGGDPTGVSFTSDVVPVTSTYHYVNKRAKHPNAARLFALWSAGPDFNQVFEKHAWTGNLSLPSSKIGQIEGRLVEEQGGRKLHWFDNSQSLELLRWYTATPEGQQYQDAMLRALKNK